MLNAVSFYRFARLLHVKGIPCLPTFVDYIVRVLFACWLPHTAKVGKNLVLGYGGLAVVIHSDAVIGNDVHIDQGVTVGGTGTKLGVPTIKDKVYIGAGAAILGPITIGRGSIIGANAVVVTDIPANSLAVGVPSRIVKQDIDIDQHLCHTRSLNRES